MQVSSWDMLFIEKCEQYFYVTNVQKESDSDDATDAVLNIDNTKNKLMQDHATFMF